MTTQGMARFSLFYFKELSRHCRLDDSVSTLFRSLKYFSSFMSNPYKGNQLLLLNSVCAFSYWNFPSTYKTFFVH